VIMSGSYDPVLVALSVAVAILASFTALNLAGRLLAADRDARLWWILAAAVALGGGIWSMHFVGMLAFVMPMPAAYDVNLTIVSLLLPIVVVGIGLFILNRFGNGTRPLLTAGVLAGSGIVAMHYTGMAAMQVPGSAISYDPWLVGASVAIAIGAATVAFWLAFRTKRTRERLAAAVVMGIAIAGMHYTAMAAASFTVANHAVETARAGIEPAVLAAAVVSVASVLLILGLVTAFFDRKLATLTAREAVALTQSEQRLRALYRNSSDIVAILSKDGIFTYEASSARSILGYRTRDLLGRSLLDLVPRNRALEAQQFLTALAADKDLNLTVELSARHVDGSWRDFEVIGKNLIDDPAIGGLVVNMRDISERKRLMAKLERLSETDALTNTLNRRGFMKLAEREFERMRRNRQPLTLVMIDIDHFKGVNDVFGHAAGDMVLSMVADCCRKHIRSIDVLGRFGGEEFIILLTGASLDTAEAIVARIHQGIAATRVTTIKGEVSVTASFGLAAVHPETIDLETAIRVADEALYEAKNSGRNCIKIRA
jgi:diguanylate cyclase (GGDEF)-like protein/PAS domain S-box-containing protein